jgi:hypothetical protein
MIIWMLPDNRLLRKPTITRRQVLFHLPKDADTLMVGDCAVGHWYEDLFSCYRIFEVTIDLDHLKRTEFNPPSGWTGEKMIIMAGTVDVCRGDHPEIVNKNLEEFVGMITKSLHPEVIHVISPYELHEIAQTNGDRTHLNKTGCEVLIRRHPDVFASKSIKQKEAKVLARFDQSYQKFVWNDLNEFKRVLRYYLGKSPFRTDE